MDRVRYCVWKQYLFEIIRRNERFEFSGLKWKKGILFSVHFGMFHSSQYKLRLRFSSCKAWIILWTTSLGVWSKLLSSRTSFQFEDEFQMPPNLNPEVSTPKILLFSSWYFMQIGWQESIAHLWTLSQRCPTLWIKVRRCPETRSRAGNSSSYLAVQNPPLGIPLKRYKLGDLTLYWYCINEPAIKS